MDAIKSDSHGNGVKPWLQHKDPSNVTLPVLMADVLFMRPQRRRLKNKLAPVKAHLLLQHVTSQSRMCTCEVLVNAVMLLLLHHLSFIHPQSAKSIILF